MSDYVINFMVEHSLKNIYLIGHSMGGCIASIVASKRPDLIKKLILISPMNFACIYKAFCFLFNFFPKSNSGHEKLLSLVYKDINSKNKLFLLPGKENNSKQMNYLGHKIMMSPRWFLMMHSYQKKITTPTLLCLGRYDKIIPYKKTIKNFSRHLSNLTIATFYNSSHMCFFEEEKLFFQTLKNFLLDN